MLMRRCYILLFALCLTIPTFAQSVVMYSYNAAGDRTGRVWGTGSLMLHSATSTIDPPMAEVAPVDSENNTEPPILSSALDTVLFDVLDKEMPLVLTEEEKEMYNKAFFQRQGAEEKAWWEEYAKQNPARLINTSYSVGAIPIEEGVSPSGARLYNLPIATAAGFKLVPSVSLAYNSQGSEGWAGYGWDIQGIPTIRLINKNQYYHGEIKAADVSASDPVFSLDGVPLVTNSHTATSASYPLETASGHILAAPEYNNNGKICRFTVLYPNGIQAVFGHGGTNDHTYVYYVLTQMTDLEGNRISFIYNTDSQAGLYALSSIRYGYDAAGNYNAEIVFSYTNWANAPGRYRAGVQVKYGKRLTSIVSRSGDDILASYSFSYTQTGPLWLLNRIDCTSGTASLSPLEFTYTNVPESQCIKKNNQSITLDASFFVPNVDNVYKRGKFVSGEYRDGILIYPGLSPYTYRYGGYGSEFNANQKIILIPRLENSNVVNTTLMCGDGFQTIDAVDVNGDGIDEMVRVNMLGRQSDDTKYSITVYRLNGNNVPVQDNSFEVLLNGVAGTVPYPYHRTFRWGDFNGDGKVDLLAVAYNQNYPGTYSQNCYTAIIDIDSQSVLSDEVLFYGFSVNSENRLIVADIDSDGRTELCYAEDNGIKIFRLQQNGHFSLETTLSSPTSTILTNPNRPCYLADFNGDGYLDIARTPASSTSSVWTIYYYNGRSFTSQSISLAQPSSFTNAIFMDVNRDGMSDMVTVKTVTDTTATLGTYINTNGSSFSSFQLSPSGITDAKGIVPVNFTACNRPSAFMKFDGLTVYNYSYQGITSESRHIVTTIDSYGKIRRNAFAYLPSNASFWNDASITVNNSQGYAFQTLPIYVLSGEYESFAEYNSGLYKSNTYEYYNGVIHHLGLGFCGFSRIRTKEMVNAIHDYVHDVADVYYLPEKMGKVKQVVKKTSTASTATAYYTQTNTWDSHSTNYGKLNPRLTRSAITDALTGVSADTYYSYDSWDFPTESRTTRTLSGSPVQREKQSKTYQHNNTAAKYVLGVVTQEATVRDLDGSPLRQWKDKKVYTFDTLFHPLTRKTYTGICRCPAGNPFAETADSTLLVTETRWVYDSHGNVTSEKSAPYGATTFTGHTYTYDSNGRYMLTDTDALSHTTTYAGYNKFGKPATVTDYRNRVTSYTYDAWGNVSAVSYPDGSTEQTTRTWGGIGCYLVTRTASGKPQTITHYDALDREVRNSVKRFNGQAQLTDKEYDRYGRVSRMSLPFRGSSAAYWNTYTYDSYNRLTKIQEASGRVTTWAYSGTSTTTVKEGITSTSTKDASGNVVNVTDAGGVIAYTLRDDGQPSALTLTPTETGSSSVTTTFVYDSYGRRTKLIDPSAGTQTESYVWNSDGSSQQTHTSPNGSVTTNKDRYGRTTSVQRAGEYNTTYTYNTYGLLSSVLSTNNTGTEYTYDNLDRVLTAKESVPDGKWLQKTYTYGTGSNVSTIKYTTQGGDITTETYSYANGHNTGITLSNGTVVWSMVSENDLGMPTQITTGTISREYGFSAYGMPTYRKMAGGSLQNVTYQFNASNGNLTSRTDVLNSQTESFIYDGLNRLVSAGGRVFTYDSNGNILSMGGVGSMAYGNTTKPYQITGLAPASTSLVPNRQQTITYTCYDRPSTLTEGGQVASFTYNGDGDRVKMLVTNLSTPMLARYYIGGQYEFDQTLSGSKERLYVGGDAYSAPMVLQRENSGSWTAYNIGRDYLGNITQIASTGGTLVASYSYDPWGRLRDPATLSIYAPGYEPSLFLGRGYTGHEHLTWFGLINMNARLYDPLVGRFLSPDPYVQAPDFTQGFNRYSYALNNPLKYNDPSGEIFGTLFGFIADFFNNLFVRTFKGESWDWTQTKLGWEIDKSIFHTDPNKGLGERIWEIISRFTWQLPQTVLGDLIVSTANAFGWVNGVTHNYGMTAVDMGIKEGAFTVGYFSAGPNGYKADWRDHLFAHEYGHYIQSQQHGPLYLFTVGFPSLQSAIMQTNNNAPRHENRWFEADASYKGAEYFDKYYGSKQAGYVKGDPNYFDKSSFIYGNNPTYINPRTGSVNQTTNPISGIFHWTDISVYLPVVGLIPALFYL